MQNQNKENFSNVDSCPICQNSQLKSLRKAKYINCENQKRKTTIFDFIIIIKCLF